MSPHKSEFYCYLCGDPTLDAYTCERCGNDFCKKCYDEDSRLCLKCLQEQ